MKIKYLFTTLFVIALMIPYQMQAIVNFDPKAGDRTGLIRNNINQVDLGNTNPTVVAVNLINAALTLLALVCVILLVYAGFLWVWARGNQDEVKKSKDIILGTVIGLVIVLSALGITTFVFQTVGDVTGATVIVNANETE